MNFNEDIDHDFWPRYLVAILWKISIEPITVTAEDIENIQKQSEKEGLHVMVQSSPRGITFSLANNKEMEEIERQQNNLMN